MCKKRRCGDDGDEGMGSTCSFLPSIPIPTSPVSPYPLYYTIRAPIHSVKPAPLAAANPLPFRAYKPRGSRGTRGREQLNARFARCVRRVRGGSRFFLLHHNDHDDHNGALTNHPPHLPYLHIPFVTRVFFVSFVPLWCATARTSKCGAMRRGTS